VDDEVDVCDVLGGWLTDNGYAVDVAVTAAAARELLSQHQYGMVVVDWRLRDGDGVALANLAAEAGSHAFVMSGYPCPQGPGEMRGDLGRLRQFPQTTAVLCKHWRHQAVAFFEGHSYTSEGLTDFSWICHAIIAAVAIR
jgi:CheY-like chemotaxis protein